MRSLAWQRSLLPPRRCAAWINRELLGLRSNYWIDIELGRSFDPHLVAERRMKHDRGRAFRHRRVEMVVAIRLFPNGAIFKSYYRTTPNAIKAAFDATNES